MRASKRRWLAGVGFIILLAAGCDQPKSEAVVESWRESLRGVLPPDASGLRILANHYDNGVRIFEYQLPPQEPVVILANIEKGFAQRYRGYVVTDKTPSMIRLRCPEAGARHWASVQYEFHVCRRGNVVVIGMSLGNSMTDALRVTYEAEALEFANRACAG